ncbi:MAG: hypothetical protein A3G24_21785, partial [Betaproteobacteria bacterium RIFCSPLOWO2_12_FULL_62_13]
MLSVKPDRPVDALTVAVSREIDSIARELKLPYFLAGAMARDIVLTHVYGIETGRATRDVDFGVAVSTWEQFDLIKHKLIRTGRFSATDKITQRIYYKIPGANAGYPVDIIPFGGVEAPPLSIAWPPEKNAVMNVVGYDEALTTAILVKIEDTLTVSIASLPGLALLKLFAWQDRYTETPKDALDLVTLFRNYHAAGNQERIYGEELALLEAVDFDIDLASPRLLGKDVRHIASAAALEEAEKLLNDAQK